jgi:hypothetical protein
MPHFVRKLVFLGKCADNLMVPIKKEIHPLDGDEIFAGNIT